MKDIVITVSNNNVNESAIDTLDAIYKAGFKKVFLEWYNKDTFISQDEQYAYCKKLNLEISFFHLGYKGINNLWLDNAEGDQLVEAYKRDFDCCHKLGIDLVCMHLCSKGDAPGPNELGLRRLKEIIDYAKALKIKIAFENTKIKAHIETVLKTFKDENVGICLDVGHLHAYFHDEMDYDLIKDRIFLVHLHDNDGISDLHLLPNDGTLDWKWMIQKLNALNYRGDLIFELVYHRDYVKMPIEAFYQKAYQIGCELENYRKEQLNGGQL